jgi:hypothetical protein
MLTSTGRFLFVGMLALQLAAAGNSTAQDSSHYRLQDARQLKVLISDQFEPRMQQNLLSWVDHISTALASVYGHWPRERWEIAIAPADSSSATDPIPWAQVHRGSVNKVEFFVVSNAPVDELMRAWTGYHELAHLLIPYRGWGDAWFSEGLASYYQNVLPARMGILSEQEMWQKLYEGFQRGLADTRFDGQPLALVSDRMRENGGFMRVYWSGAWYFLAADTRLRLQSGGRRNLDQALAEVNKCCADQQLSVPQIVAKLDELNRVVLFGALYDEAAVSTSVPPFEKIFASMGINIVEGQVLLQQEGPGARLRKQITGRPGL